MVELKSKLLILMVI